jgi:oxalate decarboxylase/phosphoglucose isomerase-like protein (cupin superfamily)
VPLRAEVVAKIDDDFAFVTNEQLDDRLLAGDDVTDLRDYLGAKGHLVALRDGDLAYLHVHPEEDRLLFEAEFPTVGEYRLFLQFDHGGTIRTGELTIDIQETH